MNNDKNPPGTLPSYYNSPITPNPRLEGSAANSISTSPISLQYGNTDYGDSKYDKYSISNDDIINGSYNEIRAQEQGSLTKLTSGLFNAITQTGLDVIKDTSYLLDYENYFKFAESSKTGFDNWLANSITNTEEKLKLPVYRTAASAGFSPLSAGWWGENLPSILSTVSMAIPAEGAIKGLSLLTRGALDLAKASKAIGGTKIVKALGELGDTEHFVNGLQGISAAVMSRQMESIMEGGQTFQDTYQKAKDAGKSDEEASQIAGEAAASNYKMNWANLITDIPQYMLLHKSFNQSLKELKVSTSEILKTIASESGEEAYQFISNEEAKRSALINSGILNDDKSGLPERLGNYAKDGNLWTAAFLGGLGGGMFGGVAAYKNARNAPKIKEQYEALTKMHTALIKGDEESFNRESDRLFGAAVTDHIKEGKLQDFKDILNKTIGAVEDSNEIIDTRTKLAARNKVIDFIDEYSSRIASDNTKSAPLKGFEINTVINQRLTKDRLDKIDQTLNRVTADDRNLLNHVDPTIYQLKLAKLEYEAIKNIPAFAEKANELKASIEDSHKLLLGDKTFKNQKAIDEALTSINDQKITDLLRNKAIDQSLLNDGREILNKINDPKERTKLEKEIKDQIETIAKAVADAKAKQDSATTTPEGTEEDSWSDTSSSGDTSFEDMLKNSKSSNTTLEDDLKALNDKFDSDREALKQEYDQKPELDEEYQTKVKELVDNHTKESAAIKQKHIDSAKAAQQEALLKKATTQTVTDIQDSVGESLSRNTPGNVTEENQSSLNTDAAITAATRIEGGINKRNNVVMMHLFNHFFDDKGVFRFSRDEEGYPSEDNDSKLDIAELNNVKAGDVLEIKVTPISDAAKSRSNKRKQDSLRDKRAKESDFDGVYLGVYSNGELVGFIQETHTNEKATNKDEAETLRQELITYRKDIINRLNKGEKVTEKVTEKGNGNLYTKLQSGKKGATIDASRKVLETIREQDKVDGIAVFAFSDGNNVILPKSDINEDDREAIELALSSYKNYGKNGDVYQVVRGITTNSETGEKEWSLVPVYSSSIEANTIKGIMSVIDSKNTTDPLRSFVIELNKYIYASTTKTTSTILVTKRGDDVIFTIGKVNDKKGNEIAKGNEYSLSRLKTDKNTRSEFAKELESKRQNIATTDINNRAYQKNLAERNTLVTNVFEYKGEYFIQPYIEYTHNGKGRFETVREAIAKTPEPVVVDTWEAPKTKDVEVARGTDVPPAPKAVVKEVNTEIEKETVGRYTIVKQKDGKWKAFKGNESLGLTFDTKEQAYYEAKNANEEFDKLEKEEREAFDEAIRQHKISDDDALSTTKDNTPLDREHIDKWLAQHLPQFKLSNIQNLADLKSNMVDSYGLYKDLVIYLFEGAGTGTGYHEAFHGVFRNLLSLEEKHALLKEAQNKYLAPTEDDLKSIQQHHNHVYTNKQLTYVYYEEKMADDFAEYTKTYVASSKKESFIDKLFRRIAEFFGIFTQPKQNKIEELFNRINTKEFKSAPVVSNKVASIDVFNKELNIFEEFAYSNKLDTVFGVSRKVKIVEAIGNQFLADFQKQIYSGVVEHEINSSKILTDIRKRYLGFYNDQFELFKNPTTRAKADMTNAAIALAIDENWYGLEEEAKKFLGHRKINVKGTAAEIQEDSNLDEENDAPEEGKGEPDENDNIESLSRDTKGFAESTTISGLSTASSRMKIFLSSIPVLNRDGSVKKDNFGVDQFYDFSKLYYYIEDKLVGINTLDEQLKRLKKLSINRPELKQVIERLTERPQYMNVEEFTNLRNDFKTNFTKQKMNMTLVKFYKDSETAATTYEIIDANRTHLAGQIRNQWLGNYTDATRSTVAIKNSDGSVTEFGSKEAKSLLEEWKSLTEDPKKALKIDVVTRKLSKLGIEYTPEVLASIIDKPDFKSAVQEVMVWRARLNPASKDADEKNARKAMAKLISFEANSQFKSYTSSFNDVENKNIYTIQLPSYATKLLDVLTSNTNPGKATEAIENLQKDPFHKYSNLLNLMAESPTFRTEEFIMSYLDGLKDGKGQNKGSKFTEMDLKDFLMMQIALFQNKYANSSKDENSGVKESLHKYTYVIPSDKSLQMIFQGRKYTVTLENIKDRTVEVNSSSQIVDKFYNVFLSESARIKNNLDIRNDIINNRDASAYRLSDLLEGYHFNKDTWNDLISPLAEKQLKGETITTSEWEEISASFNGRAYDYLYFSPDFNKTVKGLIGHTLFSTTQDTLESDLEQFKHKTDSNAIAIVDLITKELNKEISSVRSELSTEGVIRWNEKTKLYENVFLDLSAKTAEGMHEEIQNLISEYALNAMLHNIELSNLLNGDYAQYKDLAKRSYQTQATYTNGTWPYVKARGIVKKDHEITYKDGRVMLDTLAKLGLKEKEMAAIANKYGVLTDAQEERLKKLEYIITKPGHSKIDIDSATSEKKRILRELKKINATDAQVYVTPQFYKEFLTANGRWNSSMQAAWDIAEKETDPKKIDKALRVLLGGIKPFYYDARFDETLGMMRHEQVKCAMIPLFKSYIDMNPLLGLKRKELEDNNAHFMAHESAFKAIQGFRSSIDSTSNVVLELNADGFGIQVDNPEHTLDSVNNSLRQLKMLLLGSIDDTKTYNGIKGSDIKNSITDNESANIRVTMKDLNKRLNNKNNAEFTKFIKEMITKRGATINVEDILEIVDGEFKYPLDSGNLSTQLENMLTSIVTKNVIKQMFNNGGNGVQATSLGLTLETGTLLDQQKLLSASELLEQETLNWIKPDPEKGTTGYCECAMPANSKHFFDKDGFLKDINNVPQELREFVMYRIPTEGLHSMLPIRVVKFLPPTMGNFILLPLEITTQFGADFDFDKMFFMGREFYRNKKNNTLEVYSDQNDNRKNYDQYLAYNNSKQIPTVNYNEYIKLSKEEQLAGGVRNNNIIDNYLHLLTSIENYALMVTPSGFTELAEINEKYFKGESFGKANFFSSTTQRDYKDRNHTARALKGMWALHVSGHSYANMMNLTTEVRTKDTGKLVKSAAVNFNGLSGTYDHMYNSKGDAIENFNKLYTRNGSLISDKLASVMAAALDDIKDPIIRALGIDKNTSDTIAAIVRAGFDLETGVMFTAQNSIKELSRLLTKNFNKIKEPNAPTYTPLMVLQSYRELMLAAKESVNLDKMSEEDRNKFLKDMEVADYSSKNPKNIVSSTHITDERMRFYLDPKNKCKTETQINKLSPTEKARYYAFQVEILSNFINLQPIASALKDINILFGVNKEVGPNVEDIIAKRELLDKVKNSTVLKGFDDSKIPTLQATIDVHEQYLDYLEKYFPYSSPVYMDIKKTLISQQTSRTLNDMPIEKRKYTNDFIRMWFDCQSDRYRKTTQGIKKVEGDEDIVRNLKELFVTLPARLNTINNPSNFNLAYGKTTFEMIKENLFIKEIFAKVDERNLFSTIMLRGNRLDLQVKNNVIEGFKRLYANKDTKPLAIDLIDHAFANSGFTTALNSYASLIPPSILDELGYYDHRQKMIDAAINGGMISSEEKERLIDQLVRNNPKDFTSRPFEDTIFKESVVGRSLPRVVTLNSEGIDASKRSKELVIKTVKDIDENESYVGVKYIRVYDKVLKRATLYKNIQADSSDTLKYERVSLLGRKGFIMEVDVDNDLEESFVRENNTDKGMILTPEQHAAKRGARKTEEGQEEDNSSEEMSTDSYRDPAEEAAFFAARNGDAHESDAPPPINFTILPKDIDPC